MGGHALCLDLREPRQKQPCDGVVITRPPALAVDVAEAAESGAVTVVLALQGSEPQESVLGSADPNKPVRFAVGQPGHRSSVWRLWANRATDDVYLATRQSASSFKISLHASGDWHVQWVGQDRGTVLHTPGPGRTVSGRIMARWFRPPSSRAGWTDAMSIWVPAEDVVAVPGDGDRGTGVRWVPPPPQGAAVEFRLVLVRPGLGAVDLSAALQDPYAGVALVDGFRLAGGEAVLLFAAVCKLGMALQQHLAHTLQEHIAQMPRTFDLSPETGPRSTLIATDDDGYHNFWDLSLAR